MFYIYFNNLFLNNFYDIKYNFNLAILHFVELHDKLSRVLEVHLYILITA